jgi:hypothetical protein
VAVAPPFGQAVLIGNMDRKDLLKNRDHPLCRCRVLPGSSQWRDGFTLMVEAALPALNAHLGVLNKVFQVSAGHQVA